MSTSISDGLCWSLKQDRFNYIDSTTYKVESYFFDLNISEIIFEKTVIVIPEDFGIPEGMAIDEEYIL